MTKAVLVLALVLGAAALALHADRDLPNAKVAARRTEAVVEAAVPAAAVRPAPRAVVAAPAVSVEGAPSGGIDRAPAALADVLESLLRLSPAQKFEIEGILVERARQVLLYEEEVTRRGWARLADFDRRIGAIRDLAARRILTVLSSTQATAFARVLAADLPEDHLSIELDDHVVVLD